MSQYNPYGYQAPGQAANNYGGYGGPPPTRGGKKGMSTGIIVLIILSIFFLLFLMCGGILVALLYPAIGAARNAAKQVQDSNNLKQVGLALLNYEATYRNFPASYAVNSNNEKVWSWRVALLPFMGDGNTFALVDFTNMKPWNDPSNGGWQRSCNPYFQSTRSLQTPGGVDANVFMISNPKSGDGVDSFFVDDEYRRISKCTDGTSNTIVCIMLAKHGVPWASPETLTTDEAYRRIQNEEQFFLALFLDGTVRRIATSIDEATFRALVTCNGDEQVSPKSYAP